MTGSLDTLGRKAAEPRSKGIPLGRGALAAGALAVALLLGLAGPVAAKLVWKEVQPDKAGRQTCLRVAGKSSKYTQLDPAKGVELTVHGPSKLRILTRHLPVQGKTGKRSYTLVVERDGKTALRKKITRSRDAKAKLCTKAATAVGASGESVITVPRGKHTFRVTVDEPGKAVAARFFRQARAGAGARLIAFSPLEFDRQCRLVTAQGNRYTWFRATPERPVRFTVQGPTELQIHTRVDFEEGTLGAQEYVVGIQRNDRPDVERRFQARIDPGAGYEDCPGTAPGQSQLLRLSVPSGNWTYELGPTGSGAASFTTRILIPKSSVGLSHLIR
ncbi:MAG: hypothetical protein FJY75_00905 [Candidatus Eisenbacteria bacterium]|uniref:Uncharacterized protein n=1 Tax=Eiseniibacteriota bacterium TaxID=2212470 RepID=A0A937X915_UNCEI|nr:hypothetical protein [Candidatus Eisenbacteria bacterium]